MEYLNLQLALRPPRAVVTLNRPKVLNALNSETFTELDAVFAQLKTDASIRVVLLTGAGDKAFAAGADIREIASIDGDEGRELSSRGQAVMRRIETLGKPVIACIQGFALGGGCELAMSCTLRIATTTARLGQPEAKLGLLPGYGATQRLPRLVGRGAALKLLLTGAILSAEEAFRIGLVDELVPPDQLLSRAEALAMEIAANAPLAIQEILDTVDRGLDLPLDAALALESERFGRLCTTQDKAEGTAAFLEKRPPQWKGH